LENRKYERVIIDPIEIVIELVEGSDWVFENVPMLIEEVSQMGVRFSVNLSFKIDELIRLSLPSIDVIGLIEGRISWKKELGPDQYQYGLLILNE
jgi:hypothetical protein